MNNTANWIAGLMRENYEAVGFIPEPTVSARYIAQGNYVIQRDGKGRKVGYLLHGPIATGKPMVISQHCIQHELRMRGYGTEAFREVYNRAVVRGASSIRLRVADDLDAVHFWQACGFVIAGVKPGGKRRNRLILEMAMPLELPLLAQSHPPAVAGLAVEVEAMAELEEV